MNLARAFIFGLPLGALALTWWSVREARASRSVRDGGIVAMLPGAPPALNPFVPATEADRQIVDLIHEPLIRIGTDGRMQPALAERWDWSQTVTCWFAKADEARDAAAHLKTASAEQWIAWGLESAKAEGAALVMRFSKMGGKGPDGAAAEITAFSPLAAEVIRVELNEPIRPYHEHFATHAKQAAQIKRAWFDGPGAVEIIAAGDVAKLITELTSYYRSKITLRPRIESLTHIAALREPVLDVILRAGRRWHDGSAVTAEDVRATHACVMAQPWQVPNRDALREVQSIETVGATRLRVFYRRESGAVLCGWIGLPILPAAWLRAHPADGEGRVFAESTPPGAGIFAVTHRDLSSLALAPAAPAAAGAPVRVRRATFASGASPFQTKLGFATGEADLFWPDSSDVPSLLKSRDLVIRALPPRSRLLVLWNTRSPVLANVAAREALALATDRAALIDGLLDGRGRIHDGIFQPGLWFAQSFPPPVFDLARAQAKLGQAGWIRDVEGMAKRPGQRFAFELLTTLGNAQRQKLALALAAQWKKIGADVRVTAVSWSDLVEKRLAGRQFDAAILGLDFETTWDQSAFWHSSQTTGDGLNFSGIADRQIDLLLEELRAEFDPDRVPEKARALEDKLLALQPLLPLFTDMTRVAVRSSILPEATAGDDAAPWSLREFVTKKPPASPPPPPPPPPAPAPALPPAPVLALPPQQQPKKPAPKIILPEMRVPDERPLPPPLKAR